MSHGKCEPTNTNAADYKLYARFDAGETLESVGDATNLLI